MSRRVRLRPGVHVAPAPGGLSISGLGRTSVVSGDPAEWDALFPGLHQGSPLPSGPLVTILDDLGLLLDPDAVPADAGRYPRMLSYLEAYARDPYNAFQRLRSGTVSFSGPDGVLREAARRTLLQAGVDRFVPADPNADAVITVDTLTGPVDVPWIGVFLAGDLTLVGPNLPDAVRRVALTPAPVSPVVAALAGSLAAFAAALAVAGLPAETRHPQVQLIRTDGLRVSTHPTTLAAPAEYADVPAGFVAVPAEPPYPGALPLPSIACDPVTGALPAPTLITAPGVPLVVARCGDHHGYGPDPATALRRSFVAAARSLVPRRSADFVPAAGVSSADFWYDALLGCIPRWGAARLAAIAGLTPREPVADAEVTTYRVAGPGDVFATMVRSGARLIAVSCSSDPQSCLDSAIDHARIAAIVELNPFVPGPATGDGTGVDGLAVLGPAVQGQWWRGEPLLDDDVLTGGVLLGKDSA